MTNQSNSIPRAADGGDKLSSESDHGPSLTKSHRHPATEISHETSSRPDNIHYYSEPSGYMTNNSHGTSSSALNMSEMGSALPNYQSHSASFHQRSMPQHYIPAAHMHGVLYPMHMPPFPGAATNTNVSFNTPFPPVYPHYIQAQHQRTHGYQQLVANSSGIPAAYQTTGYGHTYYHQQGQPPAPGYSRGQTNAPIHLRLYGEPHGVQDPSAKAPTVPSKNNRQVLDTDYDVTKTIVDGSTPMRSAPIRSLSADPTPSNQNTTGPVTPRGPPRKPKQSGHALWVGNLPPGAGIVDLKDYFARDATKDVESVFLISKSNCAFINYKTEAACVAALSRFHDSRFQGARLVCRLRRGLVAPASHPDMPPLNDGEQPKPAETGAIGDTRVAGDGHSEFQVPNRYFVVKSLTVKDLELSRQSGIWATQSHNEDSLNRAYENAENVYLIFSANKSGEYYGYARMVSPIQEDDVLVLEMPPRPDQVHIEPQDLNVTPTPATMTAPNGRVINDAARGTIFWEADSSEEEAEEEEEDDADADARSEKSVCDIVEETIEPGFQSIGKPFRIQWLSSERVPFHRTRGLRNPWNANREVKIARDGTEIEPTVGERLLQLFHPPCHV